MKRFFRILCISILFFGLTAVSYAGTEKYGAEITLRKITAIKDILVDTKAYDGKTVTIEGKIANECPSGCWFYVQVSDGKASIYVDIGQSGFAIPQKRGKKILVEGIVSAKKSGAMIQGKGVEVQ